MSDLVQINVSLDRETAAQVDQMAREDGLDNRSAFARRLFRQEWARRYSKPNGAVTIDEALVAHAQASRSVGAVE